MNVGVPTNAPPPPPPPSTLSGPPFSGMVRRQTLWVPMVVGGGLENGLPRPPTPQPNFLPTSQLPHQAQAGGWVGSSRWRQSLWRTPESSLCNPQDPCATLMEATCPYQSQKRHPLRTVKASVVLSSVSAGKCMEWGLLHRWGPPPWGGGMPGRMGSPCGGFLSLYRGLWPSKPRKC